MSTPLPNRAVDLLIVAAFPPEIAPLSHLLGESLHATISNVAVSGKTVGVGLPNAVAGTTTRLLQLRPRAVVLIGTCGFYPGFSVAIGDAVTARRTILIDIATVEGRGALPEPVTRAVDCNPMLTAGLSVGRVVAADVGNTLGVTTDDALAARLGPATGCGVENLEAFGVANACALQNVPFACVLGVANRVGSMGRDEWRRHHRTAGQAACNVIARWLGSGAAGLPHG